jgi:hypothetical protein
MDHQFKKRMMRIDYSNDYIPIIHELMVNKPQVFLDLFDQAWRQACLKEVEERKRMAKRK